MKKKKKIVTVKKKVPLKKKVIIIRKKKKKSSDTVQVPEKTPEVLKGTVNRNPTKSKKGISPRQKIWATYPKWGKQFIKAFRKKYTMRAACEACRLDRSTVSGYKRHCKEFREDIEAANEDITDLLEESAIHRAVHGNTKLVLHNGAPVMIKIAGEKKKQNLWETKYETALTIFMMKGRRREVYYPELKLSGGTLDDKANAVLQAIDEIRGVMSNKEEE